jgi:RimJ/RimL family protein N-acetyltransferase
MRECPGHFWPSPHNGDMPYGWEGTKTRLVPLDKAKHLENAVQWMNDVDVTRFILAGDFPMSRMAEEAWFDEVMRGSEKNVHFAVETLEGEHIGFSGLHRLDLRHGAAITGSLIGRKDLWGQGYGTDSAIVRARYCFETLGLRLMLSSCMEGNESSLRMQLKAGYEVCGRYPKRFWVHGAYRDEIFTCLERETFLRRHPR